jgi:hypothetical protein
VKTRSNGNGVIFGFLKQLPLADVLLNGNSASLNSAFLFIARFRRISPK